MNQTQPYMDIHSSHMSSAQSYAPQAATAGGLSHYSQYQQPPVLQPSVSNYSNTSSSYAPYGFANGVTSPHSASQTSGPMSSTFPPLPGRKPFWFIQDIGLTALRSDGSATSWFCRCTTGTATKLPFRYHWSDCTSWYETTSHCNFVGG